MVHSPKESKLSQIIKESLSKESPYFEVGRKPLSKSNTSSGDISRRSSSLDKDMLAKNKEKVKQASELIKLRKLSKDAIILKPDSVNIDLKNPKQTREASFARTDIPHLNLSQAVN